MCSYCLFGSISTLLKEDMSEILEPIVTLMITSIRSTEGIKVLTIVVVVAAAAAAAAVI